MKQCQAFLAYQDRTTKFATEWKTHLKQQEDAMLQSKIEFALTSVDPIIGTLRLSKVLQCNKIDLQEFLDEWKGDDNTKMSFPEIDSASFAFEDLFAMYKKIYPVESYYHKSEGYMQWNTDGELVTVTTSTQQNNLTKLKMDTFRYRCLTCSKLLGCEAGWKEHAYYSYVSSKKNCRCDVFANGKYSYSICYENQMKRKRQFKGKDELQTLEALI